MGKFESIKDIFKYFSKNERILKSIENLSKVSIQTKNLAANTIVSGGSGIIKTSSFIFKYFPKISSILFVLSIFFYFGLNIFSQVYDLILRFFLNFQDIFGQIGVYYGTIISLITLIIIILTLIFQGENDNYALKEIKWYFIILIAFLSFGYILNSNYFQTHTTPEIGIKLKNQTISNWDSLVKKLTCWTPECLSKELNKNQAKTAYSASYSLSFNSKGLTGFDYTKEDLKNPLSLQFKIKSGGDLELTKIECYINNNQKPFDTIKLNQKLVVSLNPHYLDGIECNNLYKAIKNNQKINNNNNNNNNKYTIKIISYFTFSSEYLQKIPIINYNLFLKEENLNPNKDYSYNYLKERLDKKSINYKGFTQSNDALKVDDNIITDKLPLLFGDGRNRDLNFPLIVGVNSATDFGNFNSGEITEIKLPSSLVFSKKKSNYKQKIFIENGKSFVENIRLKENENGISGSSQLIQVQDLKFRMKSYFQREDRFIISVIPLKSSNSNNNNNFNNMTQNNNNNSSNNLNSNSCKIDSVLGNPDSNCIYTHNADFSKSTTPLYYKKDLKNQWLWSPDKKNWMNLNEKVVNGGFYNGEKPTQANLDFINSLNK